jgi:hypothetical protein
MVLAGDADAVLENGESRCAFDRDGLPREEARRRDPVDGTLGAVEELDRSDAGLAELQRLALRRLAELVIVLELVVALLVGHRQHRSTENSDPCAVVGISNLPVIDVELTFTSKYMHFSPGRGGARIVAVTRARESDPLAPLESLSEPVEPREMPREASFRALSAVAVGLVLILVLY